MNWEDILIKRELKDGETTITHDECKDMEKKILAEVKKEGGALGMKNLKGIGSPKKLKMVLEDMKKRGTIHEHSNGDFYTHEPKLSKKSIDLILPRGKQKVLKAEDKDYDRGLLVKLLKNGGYDMAYWAGKHEPYPVEVLVDGVSIKKDAKKVTMKFHPEMEKKRGDKK